MSDHFKQGENFPEDTRRWTNAGLMYMYAHLLRWWFNMKSTLVQRPLFAELELPIIHVS